MSGSTRVAKKFAYRYLEHWVKRVLDLTLSFFQEAFF